MNGKTVIMITGVAGYWGRQVAARLLDGSSLPIDGGQSIPENIHIIGVDSQPPQPEIKGLDFIQADIRNPLLVELLKSEGVDTVCHLVFKDSPRLSESLFDLNVMGAMKLLGACAEAGVRKVILRSSTAVYGARPNNPAFITENHPLNAGDSQSSTRYLVEIETFCSGFQRQVPEVALTILRFPSIIGTDVDTPMTRFLMQPLAPILLGFNPLMQVIHAEDVVEALVYSILNDIPGVFNVAAEGNPPLKKLIGLAGKAPVPVLHWFAYFGNSILQGNKGMNPLAPIELDYLRYPWVTDLHKMRMVMGFSPQYTTEEALREFASQQRMRKYMRGASARAYDEERLRDIIDRRQRLRERQASASGAEIEGSES